MEDIFTDKNKRMPYTVPDGFFEEMHGRLLDKTVGSPDSIANHQPPTVHSRWRFWMSAAAVVLLIAGVSFHALYQGKKTDAALQTGLQENVEAYMTDDALDEWIAIYENIDNTIL